jgi:hypothetical protein
MPVTLNNGFHMPSWFDLKSLDAAANEDETGIRKATEKVHALIEAEEKAGRFFVNSIFKGNLKGKKLSPTLGKPNVVGLSKLYH